VRVLCLGAHSDDIEIGCGGTMMSLGRRSRLEVRWVVFSGTDGREREARRSAKQFLAATARSRVDVHAFRDGFFPAQWPALKETFEGIGAEFAPDVVFTHYRDDRHQDHRVVSDLTWNTFRHSLILEYEIPKWDGDLGTPNAFVPLEPAVAKRKARLLLDSFPTQRRKTWFSEDTFLGLMRIRGIECGADMAEAFHARKVTIDCRAPTRSRPRGRGEGKG
jgi:LmbE family N-acetylglucosaminyl deacetylase